MARFNKLALEPNNAGLCYCNITRGQKRKYQVFQQSAIVSQMNLK